MVPAPLYQYVFLIVVTILTLFAINIRRSPYEQESPVPSLLLAIVLIPYIALRQHSGKYFGDTYNYAHWWGFQRWSGFKWDTENVLFDNLNNVMVNSGLTVTEFFYVIATIYFLGMWVSCRKLFPNHTLLAYLICLGAFSTFSYGVNGIKAGAAGALFLVALAYREKLWVSLIFLLLSWGFHHSMVMPVAAYALSLYFKNSNWYFWGWVVCMLIALGHITWFQEWFSGMADDKAQGYLGNTDESNWGGQSGFRYDFVLYSAMPVLLGYYVLKIYDLRDTLYENLLNMYLCTNGIWMLCMYMQYTNRVAYLSWNFYPLLIAYPCLQVEDQSHPLLQNRNIFVMLHLGFTIFMNCIYY